MERLLRLEGLRGVAALIVVLHHFVVVFYAAVYWGIPQAAYAPLVAWFYALPFGFLVNGNFAVQIFFVLSGFVLCASQYLTPRPITLGTYVQRYLRLMLPVLASVFLAWGLLKLGLVYFYQTLPLTGGSPWVGQYWNLVPRFSEALSQGAVSVFFLRQQSWYSPVLWTMGYFWLGSVMLLSFLRLFRSYRWRRLLACALVILFVRSNFFGFWVGALLADLYCQRALWQGWARRASPWIFFPALLVVVLLGSYPSTASPLAPLYLALVPPGFTFFTAVTFYHTIAASVLLLVVLIGERSWYARWLAGVAPLGSISYALYLLHALVIASVGGWVFLALAPTYSYYVATFAALIATMVVLIPVSYVYYRFIDQPAGRLDELLHQGT